MILAIFILDMGKTGTLANGEDQDILLDYIRVCIVCKVKNNLQGKKCIIIFEISICNPLNTKWTLPFLIYQHAWKTPSK